MTRPTQVVVKEVRRVKVARKALEAVKRYYSRKFTLLDREDIDDPRRRQTRIDYEAKVNTIVRRAVRDIRRMKLSKRIRKESLEALRVLRELMIGSLHRGLRCQMEQFIDSTASQTPDPKNPFRKGCMNPQGFFPKLNSQRLFLKRLKKANRTQKRSVKRWEKVYRGQLEDANSLPNSERGRAIAEAKTQLKTNLDSLQGDRKALLKLEIEHRYLNLMSAVPSARNGMAVIKALKTAYPSAMANRRYESVRLYNGVLRESLNVFGAWKGYRNRIEALCIEGLGYIPQRL